MYLLERINKNELLEKEDILKLVANYIHKNGLELFVTDFKFDDSYTEIASYDEIKNLIIFNNQKAWNECQKFTNDYKELYKIDDKYDSYLLNFFYLYFVFHELIHADQKKKHDLLGLKMNPVFMFLYELCDKLCCEDESFYNKNHDLFPMEIDANNNGLLFASNIINHSNLPRRESKIVSLQYHRSLLSNYDKVNKYRVISPFEKLYNLNNRINIKLLNDLLNERDLTKIERINLGLDITSKEYNSLQKDKIRLLIKR